MQEQKDDASKYIPVYFSYLTQLELFSAEQIGTLLLALLHHGRDNMEPDFPRDSALYIAYSFMAADSDRAGRRHAENQEKHRRGGIARAMSAQKDEKGRFLPAEVQQNPAETSVSSESRYNNSNSNSNSNSKSSSLLLSSSPAAAPRAKGDDGKNEDCYPADIDNPVALYESLFGPPSDAQKGMLLKYTVSMGDSAVCSALMIASDNDARSWAYIQKVIETKKANPDYEPEPIRTMKSVKRGASE